MRDEQKNQRYIKLYYNKNEIAQYQNNLNKNIFFLNNYTIITLNNEQNINLLNNNLNNTSNSNLIININNKYINQNSIYSLLYGNPNLKIEFSNNNKQKELEEIKLKLWKFNLCDYNWNILKDNEEKKIKNIKINLDNSLFKEVEQYCKDNNKNFISDIQESNISINFEKNYSILIDDIYYNRISTDKIKILKEKKTNSIFFLIPSIDNTILFYISEMDDRLKELLIDNKINVYEEF